MNLHTKLLQRAADNKPVRIGLIGAGKFGSMYLAQIPRTPGVHLVGIADLSPDGARSNLARVGWQPGQTQAHSFDEALKAGTTCITEDWRALVTHRRSTSSSSAPATRWPRWTTAWRPSPMASTWST